MDWIKRYEDEQKSHLREERRRMLAESMLQSEKRTRLIPVKEKLIPVLQTTIDELKNRLGIVIILEDSGEAIAVSAKRHDNDGALRYIGENRFIISSASADSSIVNVKVVLDKRIDRPGEPPDDMSMADWAGTEETIVDIATNIEELVHADIHLLLEWLVQSEYGRSAPAVPEISSLRTRRQQVGDAKNLSYTALAFAIGGLGSFFFIYLCFLGPVALWLGIKSYRNLKRLEIYDTFDVARWAIGLGVFVSFVLFLFLTVARSN